MRQVLFTLPVFKSAFPPDGIPVYGFGAMLFVTFVLVTLRGTAAAPLLAMGLAIGRIGCYLNGCCWGQVANEEACLIPLGAAHFPLLPAHARSQLVAEKYLQTTTGFAVRPREYGLTYEDPRALV